VQIATFVVSVVALATSMSLLLPAVTLSQASGAALQQQPPPVRGLVELGTGRTLTSPTSLRVA
jgi:hypothetical protein